MLVAAAAMTFVSCQKEENRAPETVSATLTMHAGVDQTKTYLDENNTVLWGENEVVKLYVGSGETAKFFDSESTDNDGKASASFTFEIKDVNEADTYALGGIYPALAVQGINNNDNPKSYKVALPATQKAEPGKYDPSAYIMVLKPEAVKELPTEYQASFRRAVALNKITLTNVPEDVTTVEITAPNNKYLAGRRYMNLTTGESGEIYDSGSQTNVVKVNGDFKAGSFDVWFCSWGVELVEGDALTVKMTSANNTYTHTITTRAEGIKFVEGDLNTLTINMASAEVEAISTIAGDYLIASKTSSGWFLMTPTNSNSYYEATDNVSSSTTVSCADFYNVADVENYVWRVAKYDNGYSIQSVNTNKYVTFSGSENKAYANAELDAAAKMDIQLNGQTDVIESMNVAGRKLKYNASSPRFAFYETTQADVYLIPWIPDTTPRINVTDKELSVVASATTVDIPYTVKNITGDITAKVADGATMTRVSASVQGEKVVVTFDANNASEAKTATIVLSYEGAQDVNVVITQEAAGATKQYYVKVTTAPTDWSGTYLIVFDDNKAHATVDGKNFNATSNALTISNGKIEATDDLSSAAVTISKKDSGYSILLPNGTYLKVSSSNTISNATPVANYISFVANTTQKGSIRIGGDANFNTSSYILYHQSTFFRCYTNKLSTSNYYLPDLYRLEEEGETPEQPTLTSRNLEFSKDAATATMGQAFTIPTLTGVTTGVTYSSSNTAVATVNASTGAITLVGAGTTTITATAPETEKYEAGTVKYTLTVSAAQGGGDPAQSVTVSETIQNIATANNWTNGTKYSSFKLGDKITVSASGSSNTGKYYTSGNEWRIYQTESPKLKIEVAEGCTIKTVKITYNISNTGVLQFNSSNITSGKAVDVNASSIEFAVGNTGSATNGQVKVTAIEVVYQ